MRYICIDFKIWEMAFTKEWLNFFKQVGRDYNYDFIHPKDLFQIDNDESTKFINNFIIFVEICKKNVIEFVQKFPNNKYVYWCDDVHHDQRLYREIFLDPKIPMISAFGNCVTNTHLCPHYAQSFFIKEQINENPHPQL